MILAVQTSALPEERPDETIFSKNRVPNWKSRFKNFLRKEGAYNFAKMAVQIKNATDDFCVEKYGDTSDRVFNMLELVWASEVTCRERIEATLKKIKNNPNYKIQCDARLSKKD